MANYSLIANSTFQPFSYQELMAPVQRMGEYHAKIADEYDKLSSQADILEAMGANDRDKGSGSYNRYKAYSDRLRAEADNLYNFGLNSESRQRLSDLRRLYNTEIVPIQNAWNKREEESKMQLTASMQNPDLRFTRDARNTSLDDYIKNPQGGYGVVNLKAIYSDMSALANNLSKLKRAGRKEGIDNFTYNLISQYGLDPNLVSDWVNNPDASPTLTNMMNQVLAKYGVNTEEFASTPNGASILNEAIGAAQMGAWSAVGEDKEHILEDKEKTLNAQAAKEIAVYQAKQALENQAATNAAAQQNMRNEGNIPLFFDKITTAGDLESGFRPSTINALELRFGAANEKNDEVLKTGILPRVIYSDGKTKIKPIKYIKKNGEIVAGDKNVDADEFLDSKGNVKATPLFYRINTPQGSNAIIMKMGGNSYLIPGGDLGNIFGESNADVDTLYELYKKRQELIDKYGEEGYYGLVDEQGNSVSAIIQNGMYNAGAAGTRRGVAALAGGYATTPYPTHITNEKKFE